MVSHQLHVFKHFRFGSVASIKQGNSVNESGLYKVVFKNKVKYKTFKNVLKHLS